MNKAKLGIIIAQIFLLLMQFINLKGMFLYRTDSIPYNIRYFINYLYSLVIIILMAISFCI